MQLWITSASVLPYTDDVCQSVVDTLLQMVYDDELRPHIPVAAWDWLKKRPLLRPECWGLTLGTDYNVIQTVRELGDIELIASYLFIVWSEWSSLDLQGFTAMLSLIREELGGIEAIGHRADLIQRLDYVQSRWELRPRRLETWRKRRYGRFKGALLELNEESMKILTGMSCGVITYLCLPTYACTGRMSLYFHVCSSSSVSIIVCEPFDTPSHNVCGFRPILWHRPIV